MLGRHMTHITPQAFELVYNDAKKQGERRFQEGSNRSIHTVQGPGRSGSRVGGVMQDPELLKKDCSSVQCLVAWAVLGTPDWIWAPIWTVLDCLNTHLFFIHFLSFIPKTSQGFCEWSMSSINGCFFFFLIRKTNLNLFIWWIVGFSFLLLLLLFHFCN